MVRNYRWDRGAGSTQTLGREGSDQGDSRPWSRSAVAARIAGNVNCIITLWLFSRTVEVIRRGKEEAL